MSWFRINRWWLVVLPVAVAIVLGGSAQRVKGQWYDMGTHHRLATGKPGRYVAVTDGYEDSNGPTSRHFEVRVAGFTAATKATGNDGYTKETPPPATKAVTVHLDWKASETQVLTECTVQLTDSRGRTYRLPVGLSNFTECVPDNHRGADLPEHKGDPRGKHEQGQGRPPSWSKALTFLLPADAKVVSVQIWWSLPDYVQLAVP